MLSPIAIFRVNATTEIGGGHLVRCLTLADELDRRGWNCVFIVNREATDTVPRLVASKHQYITLIDLEDPGIEVYDSSDHGQVDLAVLDGYAFAAPTERCWRPLAKRILVIDDLSDRAHDCDLLLDQTLGRTPQDYQELVPERCKLLLGPSYALVRPEFRAVRTKSLERRAGPASRHVMVSLGTTDPGNATVEVLRGLAELDCDSIEVIVGAACQHRSSVERMGLKSGAVITVSPSDMTQPMLRADLAIGAAGTTSWERCCLGLPTILLVIADNQRLVAEQLAFRGAALNLGNIADVTPHQIAGASASILGDPLLSRNMSQAAAVTCDGLGVARVGLVLDPERTKDGIAIYLRPVRFEDAQLLYDWQWADGARQYARMAEPPEWEEHCAWLVSKLDSPGCVLSIIEHDACPVGVVRLDELDDVEMRGQKAHEVSIQIDSTIKGRGVGFAALNALRRLAMSHSKLVATIHRSNRASLAVFERAGYNIVDRSGLFWRLELVGQGPDVTQDPRLLQDSCQ